MLHTKFSSLSSNLPEILFSESFCVDDLDEEQEAVLQCDNSVAVISTLNTMSLTECSLTDILSLSSISGADASGGSGNVYYISPCSMNGVTILPPSSMKKSPKSKDVIPKKSKTFIPATGCNNSSDFLVRCFAARLRNGITVIKHPKRKYSKSKQRILYVASDGRSLAWKAPLTKSISCAADKDQVLDLTSCTEIRRASSPDPTSSNMRGTPILRQKCTNTDMASRSFSLIFPDRTVDITALNDDQYKMLLDGFSALIYRLKIATASAMRKQEKFRKASTQKETHKSRK
mmetsp:Transcript_64618/g.75820  ORF Transcript_64618/g.75820 Transcript_64618/m.75820 type:complete len:289 (-) Transcript_64618:956-1822(-)